MLGGRHRSRERLDRRFLTLWLGAAWQWDGGASYCRHDNGLAKSRPESCWVVGIVRGSSWTVVFGPYGLVRHGTDGGVSYYRHGNDPARSYFDRTGQISCWVVGIVLGSGCTVGF